MMPPPTPTIDNEYVWIMMHGYGLVAQLSLTAAHMFKNRTDSDSMDLGAITGAFCNVNASVVRRYPAEAPFSGAAVPYIRLGRTAVHSLSPLGFPTLPVDGSGRVVGFNPNYVCSPLATFPTPATSPTAPTSSDLVETRNETF
uniref:Uncharacterized protein n=2 Tax=Caenorhabditis japonica TaxID=281687 RepID=A0A8R1EIQ7_CAEJA